jgi:hypothetical protein
LKHELKPSAVFKQTKFPFTKFRNLFPQAQPKPLAIAPKDLSQKVFKSQNIFHFEKLNANVTDFEFNLEIYIGKLGIIVAD